VSVQRPGHGKVECGWRDRSRALRAKKSLPEVGEGVAGVADAGAYGSVMASNYNSALWQRVLVRVTGRWCGNQPVPDIWRTERLARWQRWWTSPGQELH
jgi:hypothetical protein